MADIRDKPTNEPVGDLPRTAADPGHIAVYDDNDTTDSRPANVLDAPESDPRTSATRTYDPAPASTFSWAPWLIGLIVLALLLYFVFQVLF
jgi:hypothetical protein